MQSPLLSLSLFLSLWCGSRPLVNQCLRYLFVFLRPISGREETLVSLHWKRQIKINIYIVSGIIGWERTCCLRFFPKEKYRNFYSCASWLCACVCVCVRGTRSLLVYDNVRTCKSYFMHIATDCEILLCVCVPQQCNNNNRKVKKRTRKEQTKFWRTSKHTETHKYIDNTYSIRMCAWQSLQFQDDAHHFLIFVRSIQLYNEMMLQWIHYLHFPLHIPLVLPLRYGHKLGGQLEACWLLPALVDSAEFATVPWNRQWLAWCARV